MVHSVHVSPTPSVSEVVHDRIAEAAHRFQRENANLTIGISSDSIHDARVALRRSRSYLRTFARLFDADLAVGISADLKWYATYLGRVRDIDVTTDVLRAAAACHLDDAAKKELEGVLHERRDSAVAALRDCRTVGRYQTVLQHVRLLMDAPMRDRADLDLRTLLKRPWRDFRNAVRALSVPYEEQPLHDVRIRAKNLRYAGEIAETFESELGRSLVTSAITVQDRVGSHRDERAAMAWLDNNGEDAPMSRPLLELLRAGIGEERLAMDKEIARDLRRLSKAYKRLNRALR